VATGKSLRGLRAVLEQHGLERRFVSLQTPESAAGKPAPDMVLNALAETGAEAARCIVVGDTVFDMEMAANAGVAGLGVAWGYHPPAELRAAGAGAVVGHADELAAAVGALLAEPA
jgi:phosphoglycolate phosphatase